MAATEFPTLVEDFLQSCDHVDDNVPVDLLSSYCASRNDRDSAAAVASSTQVMANHGPNQLQFFMYRNIPDANRPEFLPSQFTEVDLENF